MHSLIYNRDMGDKIDIPANVKNILGRRFFRLTVIAFSANHPKHQYSAWLCRCDCGKETIVRCGALTSGNTKSCGCYQREIVGMLGRSHKTHGQCGRKNRTPEYAAFCGAKRRCKYHPDYAGRGIRFKFKSFTEFIETLGRRPSSKHSLDRINNDGHYEIGNVRWATIKEQSANKRPPLPRDYRERIKRMNAALDGVLTA